MSELKTYISAISEGFRELESSKEFRDYADFYKKYSNFIDFYSEKFDGSEKPEHEEVLEELAEQFNEKRHELLLFLAERTKHIPGLSKDGKLTETAQSFVLHQIDNNLMLNPPEPLIPSNKKLKKFYYPIYKNAAQQGEEKMEEKKITQKMREGLNALGMDDETINALKYDDALSILRDKEEISQQLDHITETQKITQEMREELNSLGMDDESINALSFNTALGILRDKEEISQKLDELSLDSNRKDEEEEIKVNEGEKSTPAPTNENLDWIDEKVRDYNGMKEAGNTAITAITPDKSAGTFTAEVDNATVTYSSPNDVTVSKGANYTVFDTMMKEPSNAGKAVRIPEDATPEFKTNLFVAAVLNGHKVNGAEDLTLDAATLAKIGLTAEQEAQLKAALPNAPKEEGETEKRQEEKIPEPQEENKNISDEQPLPGPYNPENNPLDRIGHLLDRKKMVAALSKGETENIQPKNPSQPTFMLRPDLMKKQSGQTK